MPDLARLHESVECRQRLVDRRAGIREMMLIQIDVVRVQQFEAVLDGTLDVLRGTAAIGRSATAASLRAEFRREDDVLPAVTERDTQQRFRFAVRAAVDVGDVEEIDAGIEGRGDDVIGLRLITHQAEVHTTQADRRNVETRTAQWLHLHWFFLILKTYWLSRTAARGAGLPARRRTNSAASSNRPFSMPMTVNGAERLTAS